MRFWSLFFSGLLLFVCSANASAQDWCAKAKSPDELAICGNSDLKELDRQLSSTFASLRDGVRNRQPVITEQRNFLKRRALCGADSACIRAEHQKQIALYSAVAAKLGISLPQTPSALTPVAPSIAAADSHKMQITSATIDYGSLGGAGNAMDAFIVANWDYAELDHLKTPDADATLVSSALMTRGIATRIERNIGRQALLNALSRFADSPRKDVFIFYYAGHAATIAGNSSLLLPSFKVANGVSNGEYVPISVVLSTISKLGYKKVLVVFDACRNIVDVDDSLTVSTQVADAQNTRGVKTLMSRSVELTALKDMDYAISFSSAEGQTALDTVNGQNSPFAEAFASNVREKSTFFNAIIETRRDVRKMTGDRQRPTLEMSWDEDLALSGNLLKSVEYSFNEGVGVEAREPSNDIHVDLNMLSIAHKMSEDDSCRRPPPTPGSVNFDGSVFDCLARAYNLKPTINNTTFGSGINFFPQEETDTGVFQLCGGAKFVLDLDADGRPETATFEQDRDGGTFTFERDGHRAIYYSRLGCSILDMTVYDIDKGGIADLIVLYRCGMIESCLVILSGERLVANVDGIFRDGNETNLEKYFKKAQYMGILDGLNRVALFYDEQIKYLVAPSPEGLSYLGFLDTWERGQETGMPTKQVSISRDGSITLRSNGHTYAIPNLQADDFVLKRIN
ncbi:caspase family protein [Mesorhizobium sp. B2-3-4]|uniref:caspase family protein n=1 Tax=Mesorhizobium sp. B2-3-4 TaxID=2589959 RepID=UPI0015E2742B|nr:caspase family protein [Mesorhizobium sp. B2-3-4]